MTKTIAKILALLYAGFFTLFALFSGADPALGMKGVLLNLPNLLPWLLVWIALFIAWKNSKIGSFLFFALALASMFFFHSYQGIIPFLLVSFPLIVIGSLFLVDYNKKSVKSQETLGR